MLVITHTRKNTSFWNLQILPVEEFTTGQSVRLRQQSRLLVIRENEDRIFWSQEAVYTIDLGWSTTESGCLSRWRRPMTRTARREVREPARSGRENAVVML